jgi:hypothetical protein
MDITKIFSYIRDLLNKRFFGKLIITIQDGKVEHIERRESLKFS